MGQRASEVRSFVTTDALTMQCHALVVRLADYHSINHAHYHSRFFLLHTISCELHFFFFLMIPRLPRSTLFPYTTLFFFFLKNPRPTSIHSLPPHAVFRF